MIVSVNSIYDPSNPNFINPNDVLATNPNDTAAQYASTLPGVVAATTLRTVTAQVDALNSTIKGLYLTAFNNWLINWTAGRGGTDKSTAPAPPPAYAVSFSTDQAGIKWAAPAIGTDPVCAQPTIPDAPKPYLPPDPNAPPPAILGQKSDAKAPTVDGFAVGYQATRADGSVWQKFSFVEPFGAGYFWECIHVSNG